jgi:hypothetical protein
MKFSTHAMQQCNIHNYKSLKKCKDVHDKDVLAHFELAMVYFITKLFSFFCVQIVLGSPLLGMRGVMFL